MSTTTGSLTEPSRISAPPPPGGAGRGRRRRRLRASLLKIALARLLYWLARVAPASAIRPLLRAFAALARLAYVLPKNPLRSACRDIADIAAARGIRHEPRAIYRRYLAELQLVLEGFLRAYREGPERALEQVDFAERDVAMLRRLLDEHGGVVLCVPHNIAAAFSGVAFSRRLPTLTLAKNQKYAAMEHIAREGFARLGVDAILVRSKSMVEASRLCLAALRSGKVVIATVENVYRKTDGVPAPFLGGEPLFYPWPAKLAVKRKVPLVPGFAVVDDGVVRLMLGEPLVPENVERGVRHYVAYLDRMILEEPGSWAFLADRRWRARLAEAARRVREQRGELGVPRK